VAAGLVVGAVPLFLILNLWGMGGIREAGDGELSHERYPVTLQENTRKNIKKGLRFPVHSSGSIPLSHFTQKTKERYKGESTIEITG